MILTVILLNFNFILHPLFYNYIIYIYYIPILILLYHTFKIPLFIFDDLLWQNTCSRLRWSALFTTALLPFWVWWQKVNDNIFLLTNACLLALFASWYVFNLTGILRIITAKYGMKKLYCLSRFTRIGVIYLTFGPLLAFSAASTFTSSSSTGTAIYLYLMHLRLWTKLIIQCPVFLSIIILLQTRQQLKNLNVD